MNIIISYDLHSVTIHNFLILKRQIERSHVTLSYVTLKLDDLLYKIVNIRIRNLYKNHIFMKSIINHLF